MDVEEDIELVVDSFSALGPGLDAVTSIWILLVHQKQILCGETNLRYC